MKISVVIPAYNAEKYLEQCLVSVKNQTTLPSEILVVDDGSTDKTEQIAVEHADRVVRNEVNMGIGASRQRGAEEASGEYVAFLSADDAYHSRFIETVTSYEGKGPIFTDYYRCDPELKPTIVFEAPRYETRDQLRNLAIEWALQKNLFVNFSSVVIPKLIFQNVRFQEELRRGEDLIFFLDTIIQKVFWTHISVPLVYYRVLHSVGSKDDWSLLWQYIESRMTRLGVDRAAILAAKIRSQKVCFPPMITRIRNKTLRIGQKMCHIVAKELLAGH